VAGCEVGAADIDRQCPANTKENQAIIRNCEVVAQGEAVKQIMRQFEFAQGCLPKLIASTIKSRMALLLSPIMAERKRYDRGGIYIAL
jgi:hypothetical protein